MYMHMYMAFQKDIKQTVNKVYLLDISLSSTSASPIHTLIHTAVLYAVLLLSTPFIHTGGNLGGIYISILLQGQVTCNCIMHYVVLIVMDRNSTFIIPECILHNHLYTGARDHVVELVQKKQPGRKQIDETTLSTATTETTDRLATSWNFNGSAPPQLLQLFHRILKCGLSTQSQAAGYLHIVEEGLTLTVPSFNLEAKTQKV